MSSKRSILVMVLTLAALSASVVLADSGSAWEASESAVPDSPSYKDRVIVGDSQDTNAVWQSLESDNPHSVDFENGTATTSNPNTDWAASESDNPHSVDFKNRSAAKPIADVAASEADNPRHARAELDAVIEGQ